ncbi:MAG: heme-binding protein [Bacteroidetes bacterium]|nr:heme-binding protein [Bacteroidota bacterium]
MKKWMWFAVVTFVFIGIAISVMAFKNADIETPAYTVVRKLGEVEIRQYPSMVVAKTSLNSASFDQAGNQGFRSIAGYIFGGNENNQKIAMTAPVVMNMGDSASMYFVMPSAYKQESLPIPSDKNVQIETVAQKTLAVLRYGGFSSDEKIKVHCEELRKSLQEQGIQTVGAYLYMGYNAPWDVINRRNEVAIEVVN